MRFDTHRIRAERVRSLAWRGDALIDFVAGGVAYTLDGGVRDAPVRYAYRFDACAASPDGRYAVIHERLGTKGLLLKDGKPLRELHRSFYCADMYEYPVCLWHSRGGRTLLAHCPNEYNLIEIEDADTGQKLASHAAASQDEAEDFFHSRLQPSPSGKRLLSAGWVWHPWDAVVFFDLARALEDPSHLTSLDGCTADSRHIGLAEEASATWLTDDLLVLSGSDEPEEPEEVEERESPIGLRPRGVSVYDVASGCMASSAVLDRCAGTMMAAGREHIVAFHGDPRLIRLADGEVIHEWPDLHGGDQLSSISHHIEPPPPLALDPRGARFALAQQDEICVVQLHESAGD